MTGERDGASETNESLIAEREALRKRVRYLERALARTEQRVENVERLAATERELMLRLQQELESQVGERERAEEELRAAKERAEQAVEAKSRFVANMSHEIRTPLNGLVGMIDLILDTSLPEDEREYIAIMKSSADSLMSLLDGLLDFSKLEAGKIRLNESSFDIGTTVDQVLGMVAARAVGKGIELFGLVDPEVPRDVIGDGTRVQEVLAALVDNATKFTDSGRVVVTVSPADEEAPDEGTLRLHCTVEDTGVGFPEGTGDSLFEMFTQGDASTTRRFGGTGLGLAICKKLVELMGGRIGLVGDRPVGALVWLTIPVKLPRKRRSDGHWPARPEDMRLLLVEPHPLGRLRLEQLAGRAGVPWVSAADGRSALALAAREVESGAPPRIVVHARALPDMSAVAFADEMRARLGGPARLIAVDEAGAVGRHARSGGSALARPVRQAAFLSALHDASAELNATDGTTPALERPPRARVLLVDDHALNRRVFRGMIESAGYEVLTASDGEQAIALAEEHDLAAILMDCEMPGTDGFEATRRIRRLDGKHGRVPILALSAYPRDVILDACLAAGMDECLGKPVLPDALADALREWTAKGGSR